MKRSFVAKVRLIMKKQGYHGFMCSLDALNVHGIMIKLATL